MVLLSAALLGALARLEFSYGHPQRRLTERSGARFLAHICRGVVTNNGRSSEKKIENKCVCVCVCLYLLVFKKGT